MGASNSKPQTVEMANKAPFQISRDVAERIEKTAKSNAMTDTDPSNLAHSSESVQLFCEKCKCSENAENQPVSQNTASTSSESDTGTATATCTPTSCSISSVDATPIPCSSTSNQMVAPAVAVIPWEKRSIEVEGTQFDKALDRVNKLFGKPVKWAKECSGDINDMEKRLAVCYRDFPDEPLKCAQLAKDYHSFVFTKQFEEMTKERDANSQESEQGPAPESGQKHESQGKQ